jgi:hypothetical protein
MLLECEQLHHGMKFYCPGPVANESQVSRIIVYSSGCESQFKKTKQPKEKVIRWHDDPRFSSELITSKLECSPEDVQMMLRQWIGQ